MLGAIGEYVRRRHWVVLLLVALWVAIFCANDFALSFRSDRGFGLTLDLLLEGCFIAWIVYSIMRPDFWAYIIVSAAIVLTTIASALWFAIHIKDVESFAFGHSYRAFDYYSRLALTVVSIPTLIALFAVWRPLYAERTEIRKLTDTGLVNRYVEVARALYRFWIQRNFPGQEKANRQMALLYYEVKRRDPTLQPLYKLLKEPDDFVRITVARQLLTKKNDAALDVLDAIARQHSEWSGQAQRMATQWRNGELKAWG